MPTRKTELVTDEYYHIYNRGVEKREIVSDKFDILRFLKGLDVFNTTERVGSIFEHDLRNRSNDSKTNKFGTPTSKSKLVEICAYNILGNHFHLVIKQVAENGISKYMQSVSGGYTKYFNEKHDRVGALFQGAFKSVHIDDDTELNKVLAYVNLNHVVHKFGTPTSKWGYRSSLEQYVCVDTQDKRAHNTCVKCCVPVGIVTGEMYVKNAMEIVSEVMRMREDSNLEVGVPNNKQEKRKI